MWGWFPDITVDPRTNLSPDQSLTTLLDVKNVGRLPAWNVRFSYELRGSGSFPVKELAITPMQPIGSLAGGESRSRKVALSSVEVTIPFAVVNVSYTVPWTSYRREKSFWFAVESGTIGFLLVPTSPRPDVPVLIRF